jgi:antitoxin FitA
MAEGQALACVPADKSCGRRYTYTDMVPTWWEHGMPTTLTLKNIPDEIYARLRAAADAHRRSMNSEVIFYLERALLPTKMPVGERLERLERIHAGLEPRTFDPERIDAEKRQGRP